MSDTSGGESGGLPKKKSFTSRMSKKIHNPFKRSNSGSSSDDDESTKSKSPGSVKSRKSKSSFVPSMPSNFSFSPGSPDSATGPDKRGIPRREAEHAVGSAPPVPPRQPAAVPPPGAAAAAAAAAPAAPITSPARPARAPAGTTNTLPSQSPVKPAANTTGTATAAAAAGGPGAGNVPAGEAAAAAAAAVPKPRTVAGGPVYGAPSIVMMGVKGDPDAAMLNLRTRGFVVHLAMVHEDVVPPTMTIVLAMGPKLMVKSAVERNLPAKDRKDYTSNEVSQLCADAVQVIMRSGVLYDEMTLLHDKVALEGVAKAGYKEAPTAVNSYFGPYVGMYFAWLSFYTKALIVPTIGGLFLFLDQWRTGSPDSLLLPIFCVLIMVWTALFLDLWRRRNSSIAFRWGVDGVEDKELMRIAAHKEGQFAPSPAGKLCMTVPIILAAIYTVIRVMLYCIWLSDHAAEVYGAESYMQYYPLVLYSGVPIVASFAYEFLAKALNDFEEHPTPVRKKNALIIKMFAFQFVNSYCALLYVGFWLRDINRLRQLVMMMMMVKQFVAQIVEMYQPVLMRWLKDRNDKKNPPKAPTFLVKHTGTISAEELLEEMKADPADVEADYLEMVLQFGYISMFFVVFPLAPLFAILNNVWEFKLDLSKLVKTRRPQTHEEASIGAWQLCLEMIGVVACLTNLLLAVIVSQNISSYVPSTMTETLGSFEAKLVLVVVAEHVLFLLRAISSGLIDKVPRAVREAQAIIAVQQKQERREFRRLASGLPASEKSTASFASLLGGGGPTGKLKQLSKTHGVWNFGPMWHLPLAMIPFLIAWFEVSALWVLPTAFVFVSYLQHRKDSCDKAMALGIVKDPQVLKLVTDFLPAWYTDSEVERVDWLNKTLDKMWVNASGATADLFDTTIQPILDSYRPAGVSALGFRKVSLGTIPPKIVGVRALEQKGEKAVLDIDIRWAGNAEFVVEAGVKPVPLLVTLNKICFSGRMRVVLLPLVPVFPCFGMVNLTFMEKPFISFDFSLGKLELMSIGPGDMNVGNLVSDIIKNIITDLMVFPAVLPIPILDDQDVQESNPTPSGVVQLTVVGCDNVRAADLGGKSDPYVKVKLGINDVVKTDYKKRTLSPRFDESFDLMVYERSVEVLELSVYDRDTGPGDDDFLGSCELPLSVLQSDVESSHNIPLSKTTSGSVLIKATFVPLSSGKKRMEQPDEDVIVDVDGDNITDDTVAGDVYQNLSADGQPMKPPEEVKAAKGPAVDPSTLKPQTVHNPSDTSLGVLTVMGIECKGVKPGDRYVSVICGNTKRKTAVHEKMSDFACTEVFHYLVKGGTKSAVVEILLKEKESIGNDKCLGSFKVMVAEVMANDDKLDGEWDLTGEKAKGTIKMRLKWAGRAGDDP